MDTSLGIRDFEHSLPMALLRARETVMRRFRPILASHGVSEQQWRVLRALAEHSAPVSVGELASSTCLLGPSLSRMLVSLEERQLISRVANVEDGRRSDVVITGAGLKVVATIAPLSEREYASIEEQLGGDLDRLHALLARVAELD